MFSENMQTVRALLDAIKADWALVDDSDDDDFYLLVNEDRDEHPTLKPGKALVRSLEDDGYLEFDKGLFGILTDKGLANPLADKCLHFLQQQ